MDRLFADIYRNKCVLVTGHTGFKGSWLSFWLQKMGAKVIGYSIDIPTSPSHFQLLDLDITSIVGDVLDKDRMLEVVKTYQPDVVFHMAAQPLVRESYADPTKTFETNIMGTVNVLEACRKVQAVKAIVNITSDKCYQNNETGQAYKEGDPMGGHDPYSASKGAAELVANSYRSSFFSGDGYGKSHTTLLADVRAGNVIGGGDWAKDRLIPDLVKAAEKGETVTIRNPHAIRPWQHVLEPLSGYLQIGWKLLEGKEEFAENWNFGPSDASVLSVAEVVDHSMKHWENIKHKVQEDPNRLHEAHLLSLDSSKAQEDLGWKPVWNSHEAIEKTVTWYKEYYAAYSLRTEEDLNSYVESAKDLSVEWITA